MNLRRAVEALLCFGLLAAPPAVLAAEAPTGRVEVHLADGEYYVGQHVPLSIKLLAPGATFDGAPAFDLPEASGLIVMKVPGSAVIGTATVDGVDYVTQIHEFALYPQRAGAYVLPPSPVRFGYSAGFGKPVQHAAPSTSPVKFTAKSPPGAEHLPHLVSTKELTVEDRWRPEATEAAVGGAFVRTITFKVDDVPGMAIPPSHFTEVPGLRIYRKPPVVQTHSERGALSGVRIETATYVCQAPGEYTIPPQTLRWWDLDDKTLKEARLEKRTFRVAGTTSAPGDEGEPPAAPAGGRWFACGVVLAAGFAAAAWFMRKRRGAVPDPVRAALADLRAACFRNDRREILRSLTHWLDLESETSHPPLVEDWARATGDAKLAALVERLSAELYGPAPSKAAFPGEALWESIDQTRRRTASARRRETQPLAPLNPAAFR